jgi:hypothetical protein
VKTIIKWALVLIVLLVFCVVVYLFVPYERYEYVRSKNQIQTVTVEYANMTGNPLCSKLYFVIDGEVTRQALLARLPSDIPDPNRVDQVIDGRRLIVTGYPNLWRATNLITGSVKTRNTGLFDIVSWRDTSGQEHKTNNAHFPENFISKNYIDCLD